MNSEFPQPTEEVTRLAHEMEALRGEIQLLFRKLSQMEKRLRATFPSLPKKPKISREDKRPQSNKNEQELEDEFQAILRAVEDSGAAGFDAAIAALQPEDVIALAIELGVAQPKGNSLNKAIVGIRKRVQERRLLGPTRHEGRKSNEDVVPP